MPSGCYKHKPRSKQSIQKGKLTWKKKMKNGYISPNTNKKWTQDSINKRTKTRKRNNAGKPSPLKGRSNPNVSKALTGRKVPQSTIDKKSKTVKEMYKDPEYKDWRMKQSRKGRSWYDKKPNNEEKKLAKVCRGLKVKLRYNGNGRYFTIGGLAPDFQLVEQKDKFIEYYGTNWHADPKKYKPNHYLKETGHTAKEIWEKDKKRLKRLKKAGCKILIVWTREFKNIKKLENKILRYESV